MTTLDERYPDVLDQEGDEELLKLLRDLDAMRAAATTVSVPSNADAAVRRVLAMHAARPTGSRALSQRVGLAMVRRSRLRTAITSVGLTLAVVAGGIVGYTHFQAATPVSAQKILHQSLVAMGPPPSGVIHQVTTYKPRLGTGAAGGTKVGGEVATNEQWTEFSSDGTVANLSSRLTVDGQLAEQQVVNKDGSWNYDPRTNTVIESSPSKIRFMPAPGGYIGPKALMFQPQDPTLIRSMLLKNSNNADIQLLPPQKPNGQTLDVVQVTRDVSAAIAPAPGKDATLVPTKEISTFYIDASSYVIQRIDQQELNSQGVVVDGGSLTVSTYETVPASAVPAGTFNFVVPAGAHVQTCTKATPPKCG